MLRVAIDETLTITPFLRLDHEGQHRAAAPQRRKQRAPDLRLDLLLLVLLVGLGPDRAADVVDENVDALELRQRLGHHACAPAKVSRSASKRCRSAAGRVISATTSSHQLRAVDRQHRAAFGRNGDRHTTADALRGTGDDDDLVARSGRTRVMPPPAPRWPTRTSRTGSSSASRRRPPSTCAHPRPSAAGRKRRRRRRRRCRSSADR